MKLAVLSDIHGNLPALRAVLEDVERERVDTIVNLGDILSGPLLPRETADFLMARDLITIAGNHERQVLQMKDAGGAPDLRSSDGYAVSQLQAPHYDWLRTLPATHWLADDVLLVHGTPSTDLVYWLETITRDFGNEGSRGIRAASAGEIATRMAAGGGAERASLVLCGHSHVPRVVQSASTLVVNPGSVGLQAYEDDHVARHCTENGSPHARYAIVERRPAGWTARLCSVAYDWHAMERLAAANGRPDWAHALATGRMPALGQWRP
ncbi:metallophosphoesterase family protein [Ramlibacter pallidus]|uniref:Metallophosphoesterase family protein n=1 Tax=Ramlibacter pallidus TaxID=2780087 RepID=A0ABR9S2K0_9BURK|nr:metallophosphoesterase family protein [Ramlibacter pallidus]MBE7367713.1 metallophosphoesterase family protein [Ramlibacter pallidus]